MAINKQWHTQHKMPKYPSREERLRWHQEHEKHCACRKMPEKLRAELQLHENSIILLKENEQGKTFKADNCKILYRNKGSISGDNAKNVKEVIYLVTGSAEITIRDAVRKAQAPAKIAIPANTYHRIRALTNISFIMFEK